MQTNLLLPLGTETDLEHKETVNRNAFYCILFQECNELRVVISNGSNNQHAGCVIKATVVDYVRSGLHSSGAITINSVYSPLCVEKAVVKRRSTACLAPLRFSPYPLGAVFSSKHTPPLED